MHMDPYGITGKFGPGDLKFHLASWLCYDPSDGWHRVGLTVLHDIQQIRRQVDFVDVKRAVTWARTQLEASAPLPSTVGASAQLPM